MHARMRHRQSVFGNLPVAVEQDVEIERARRIDEGARAAACRFEPQQRIEQGARRQRRFERAGRIDEIGLVGITDRCGAIKR